MSAPHGLPPGRDKAAHPTAGGGRRVAPPGNGPDRFEEPDRAED